MTLRPGQRTEAALLFAWNYCAVSAFFVGRSVRDALFLAHESPSRLPLMYVASPLAVSLVGLLYARVADRVRRDRLVRATSVALAALAVGAWWALGERWVYYALYVGVEVMGALLMMQFWTSAGDRFSPREARRVFGLIAAGGTVANITVGALISQLVTRTGAEALLLAVAGFLLAVALFSTLLARRPGARRASPRAAHRPGAATGVDPPGAGHLRLLGPMIACGVLASTLLDFQFKTIAVQTFAGDRVAMLRFFALLSSGIGAVSLFVQFFVTARVLERFGVTGALLFLPGTLGLSALGILASPTLPAAAVSEGGKVFRFTLHDAAMQLLYLPVPAAARGRRKATIDGVIKPGTEALAGAGLLAYRAASSALAPLAAVTAAAACFWIVAVLRLRPAYARSLAETLRRRRIPESAPDDVVTRDIERAAREALRSGDPATLRHALDLARLAPRALDAELRALAGHPDAAIRAGALTCLAPCGLSDAELDRALADDTSVRAAAARAARPSQLGRVSALLDAAEPLLVAAAAESLHSHGDAEDRARVVARASALLADPRREARSLGLEIARRAADLALLPALVLRFADRRESRRAAEAAAAVGTPRGARAPRGALLFRAAIGRDPRARGAGDVHRAGRGRGRAEPRRRGRPRRRLRGPRTRPRRGPGGRAPRGCAGRGLRGGARAGLRGDGGRGGPRARRVGPSHRRDEGAGALPARRPGGPRGADFPRPEGAQRAGARPGLPPAGRTPPWARCRDGARQPR
ncbi:MAG: hypothetical protein IPF99_17955 [Deltaproteobacteria bacterium]|nr:hypothetical protein [Deltaproteobacteria bacterium]